MLINSSALSDIEEKQGLSLPPEHLPSDFVEMTYLMFVILLGAGINLHVFRKLMAERRKNLRSGSARNQRINSFLILKINLNISDLCIVAVPALGKLVWLTSYEWIFGNALCRLFNFLSMFSLYLSSNIVVCIALDRLRTVVRAKRLSILQNRKNPVCLLVVLAWLLALVWSLPQFLVWTTYNVLKSHPGGWIQCTDIWRLFSVEHYETLIDPAYVPSGSPFLSNTSQQIYDLVHLALVFYGPLLLLMGCYFTISMRLRAYANRSVDQNAVNSSSALANTHSSYSISMNTSFRAQSNSRAGSLNMPWKCFHAMGVHSLRPPTRKTSSRSISNKSPPPQLPSILREERSHVEMDNVRGEEPSCVHKISTATPQSPPALVVISSEEDRLERISVSHDATPSSDGMHSKYSTDSTSRRLSFVPLYGSTDDERAMRPIVTSKLDANVGKKRGRIGKTSKTSFPLHQHIRATGAPGQGRSRR